MNRFPLHPKSPLKPTPKDKRDFKLGNVFDLPKITEIPLTDWIVSPLLGIKNQARIEPNNDECTAYATSEAAEAHEGMQIDPNYTFGKEKMLLGNWQSFGGDLRTAMTAGVKFGFLPVSKSPFLDRPRDFVANWQNWPPEYDQWAEPQKQQSYFSCDGNYDLFDNIRASLWKFKDNKNLVVAGSYWYPAWSFPAVIPDERQMTQPSGHAFAVIGQKMIGGVPYLVVQQSYGCSAGDNGLQCFSRTVVNREWKDFGAFMFVDMSPDSAKELNRTDIITQLINLWKQLLYSIKPTPAPVPPQPTPTPVPDPTPVPKYLWDTPDNAQHSVRVICDEEGLTLKDKNDLTACVHVESNFNPKAQHQNRDRQGVVTSTDYGIVQVNDFWHIGPGKDFPTVDYVLTNPEACVRWMARLFKSGRKNLWSSYNSGAYQQYL